MPCEPSGACTLKELDADLKSSAAGCSQADVERILDIMGDVLDIFAVHGGAWALACLKEPGFEALAAFARDPDRLVWGGWAVLTLASMAADGPVRGAGYLPPDSLTLRADRLRATHPALREYARQCLREIAISLTEEHAAQLVGQAMSASTLADRSVGREIMRAFASRWFTIGESELSEYTQMIEGSGRSEPHYHKWFELHPQMLDPLALRVASMPKLRGVKEPDFVVQRFDDTYVVVELKRPDTPVLTQRNLLSSQVSHAIQQAQEYVRCLGMWPELLQEFPGIDRADRLVVAGLHEHFTPEQRAAVRSAELGSISLRLVGFDWLAQRARRVAANVLYSPPVSLRPQPA